MFLSSTSAPAWTELGPIPGPSQTGFLPNVAVTALALFNSGGQNLLRASTYGRGIWQFNLVVPPDYQLAISNSPQTVVSGHTATFNGTATALNGYANSVALSCVAGVTAPPSTCTIAPPAITPVSNTSFTVTASGRVGDYYFNVQGLGSDSNRTTHQAGVELHILSNNPDFALSEPTSFPTVNAGSTTTSGPISVTAVNGFTGTISLTCSLVSGTGSCSVNPATVTSIPSSPNVTVNATALTAGSYQLLVGGTSGATTHTLLIPFNVADYRLSGTQPLTLAPGAQGSATFTITPSTYYAGRINATCDASALAGATCTFNLGNPITVSLGSPVALGATINAPPNAAPGTYNINIDTQDTSGTPSHGSAVTLTVAQNFMLTSSTTTQTVTAGQITGPYNLTIAPVGASFGNAVTLSCSDLPAGTACAFNPSTPITPGNSSASVVITISTSASTSAGTYPVTVTASSSSLSHSVTVSLVVMSIISSTDFQLKVTQAYPANIDAGSSQTAKVSLTPNYNGTVNAICDASAISGAQCSITPPNPAPIAASTALVLSVALNVPQTTAPAAYTVNLTVADASGQPSHTLQLPLIVIPDFAINSTTPSQTVHAGQPSGPYNLTIQPVGASFNAAVTLACSSLPALAQCSFNPSAPVTPGNSSASVVMTISTTASTAALRRSSAFVYAMWLLLPGIVTGSVAAAGSGARRRLRLPGSFALLFLLLTLVSCGGVSNGGGGGGGHPGTPPGSYSITISGTSSGVAHSTQVALVVN